MNSRLFRTSPRSGLAHRCFLTILPACLIAISIALSGCGSNSLPAEISPGSAAVRGRVQGGQQPVSGSVLQLYAAGSAGDASAATPLLKTAATTDQYGGFSISNDYTCPVSNPEVYLVASGGNPGLISGTNNKALSMMAALGPCGSLSSSTPVFMDEITTVGSIAALHSFMASMSLLGSGTSDAAQLTAAFSTVNEFTNIANGVAPGPALPSGYYASSNEIDLLADAISSCINSYGGTAYDGSACGNLFALAKPVNGTAPTDVVTAVVDILNHPTANVSSIAALAPSVGAPFQPTNLPPDWTLPIVAIPATPTLYPAAGSYSGTQTIFLGETTPGVTVYYTLNGNVPTAASTPYTGPFTVSSSATVQAVAASSRVTGSTASAAYTILPGPVSISSVGGSGQSAAINTAFTSPLVVQVLGSSSNPFAGAVVSFSVIPTSAGANLSASSCTTGSDGMCSVTATANAGGGTYSVLATLGSLNASFTLSNTGTHAYVVAVSTDDATGVAANCVDQNSSSHASNANCSLRDALAAAAANATSASPATIGFAQTSATTITLGQSLSIPSYTTIQGATSGSGLSLTNLITVSGGFYGSGITLFTEAGGVVQSSINNLILVDGSSTSTGGAIAMYGSLSISECTFSSNSAQSGGAIANGGGTLNVSQSTFVGNLATAYGGAIDNYPGGTLNVSNSTFTQNAVPQNDGGAIYNHGIATIVDSTIYNNSAAYGGGVYNIQSMTVTNSIVSGNSNEDCGGVGCAANWTYVNFSTAVSTTQQSGTITIAFSDSLGNTFSQTVSVGSFSSASSVAATFGPYFYENFSGLDTTFITGQAFSNLLVITPANGATLNPFNITYTGTQTILAQQVTEPNPIADASNVVGYINPALGLMTLGNYGGPTQTLQPSQGPAICTISPSTATGTDQRGQPRSVSYGPTTCQDAGSVQTSH